MKKLLVTTLLAGTLAFAVPTLSFAEETAAPATEAVPATEAAPPATEAAPAGPSAEEMAKMMAMMQPGEMHKKLETLVGSWTYTSTMQKTADAPAEQSTGTSENAMVYGGRFLVSKVSGTMNMGGTETPFEGQALTGYDNIAQHYQGVWYDSFATGMMISTGTFDEATQTITEKAEASCPMTGAKRSFRNELKFIDADHYSYTMHATDPTGGAEFKMMEIQYTKAK
ncbi:MAG: DUF1579 family protein [Alphaproteobacteria bacterium]|nr:DUF1579 family protein [Alphaproteobacteria bacterium]MBP7759924.1 DUF1579 family protein [Alphaproteobacteria bacterium]MBP7763233.1 DUF1579 family protein [Alphaproteobacteria bacterium]MBP7906306.1 DUF1579 family protein [Alphaproteobacteria bacterium]